MKKFDRTVFSMLGINDNLLNELERLEKFHYGCLYDDGSLVDDIEEIKKREGWHIVVQSPEMFLKNKIGMCHDASIYIDKICSENKIDHKCVYIASHVKPKEPTHSFVIVKTDKEKFQVIDVFATSNCLWKLPFDTIKEAVAARVDEWIKNDNDGSNDLVVFIGNHMPPGNCTFVPYSEKVVSSMDLF